MRLPQLAHVPSDAVAQNGFWNETDVGKNPGKASKCVLRKFDLSSYGM